MEDKVYAYLALFLTPIVSAVTWFVSRRQRRISSIESLQGTVDMLLEQNKQLTHQIIDLRQESLRLNRDVARVMTILTIDQLAELQKLRKDDRIVDDIDVNKSRN